MINSGDRGRYGGDRLINGRMNGLALDLKSVAHKFTEIGHLFGRRR